MTTVCACVSTTQCIPSLFVLMLLFVLYYFVLFLQNNIYIFDFLASLALLVVCCFYQNIVFSLSAFQYTNTHTHNTLPKNKTNELFDIHFKFKLTLACM